MGAKGKENIRAQKVSQRAKERIGAPKAKERARIKAKARGWREAGAIPRKEKEKAKVKVKIRPKAKGREREKIITTARGKVSPRAKVETCMMTTTDTTGTTNQGAKVKGK